MHDRARHLAERWITVRLRYAIGDLFLGGICMGRPAPHCRLVLG